MGIDCVHKGVLQSWTWPYLCQLIKSPCSRKENHIETRKLQPQMPKGQHQPLQPSPNFTPHTAPKDQIFQGLICHDIQAMRECQEIILVQKHFLRTKRIPKRDGLLTFKTLLGVFKYPLPRPFWIYIYIWNIDPPYPIKNALLKIMFHFPFGGRSDRFLQATSWVTLLEKSNSRFMMPCQGIALRWFLDPITYSEVNVLDEI